ncbi:MAG TPA: hypothetical protein ENG79_07650 [Desulfobacteraceae bacterium]|nr:hypothetical protein [Desulfobacteraceae bacterium]
MQAQVSTAIDRNPALYRVVSFKSTMNKVDGGRRQATLRVNESRQLCRGAFFFRVNMTLKPAQTPPAKNHAAPSLSHFFLPVIKQKSGGPDAGQACTIGDTTESINHRNTFKVNQ